MAQDPDQLVVASYGEVYVADVGTTLPTSPTAALNAGFTSLGYVTEDGVSLSVEPEIEEFMAWQSRQAVRRELTGQSITVSFALEQWNTENLLLAFGGGEVTSPSAGVFKYAFPEDDDGLQEKSIVVEWKDGQRDWRFVASRGNVTDAVETNLNRSNLAVLPITFQVLDAESGTSAYILTDDSAFTTGS